MDLEKRVTQYCESNCAEEDCLNCQLHQFMELRQTGQSLSSKPTTDFRSETHSYNSLSRSSFSSSFSGSTSLSTSSDSKVRGEFRQYALSPLEKKIYDAFQKTDSSNTLENVQVSGRKAVIGFASSPAYNPSEQAIAAAIRLLASFAVLTEVEVRVDDVYLRTTTALAKKLLGQEAFLDIGEDWSALWSYLRPIKKYPELASKVFRYLEGLENDVPEQLRSLGSN